MLLGECAQSLNEMQIELGEWKDSLPTISRMVRGQEKISSELALFLDCVALGFEFSFQLLSFTVGALLGGLTRR